MKKNKQFVFRIGESRYFRVKSRAADLQMNISELIRMLIDKYLSEQNGDTPQK
jgi:predicted DNA binding CopG/RHH family protein